MSPSRRSALVAFGATTLGIRPFPTGAADPVLSLSTFTTDVTVPLGHPLMGGGIAPAKEIQDSLFALGFVLHGVGKPVVFVAIDWCEIRNAAYDLFRSEIARAVDTDPVRVMVSSLHQHDAPIADLDAQLLLEKHRAEGAVCDVAFVKKSIARVAATARESLKAAKPVTHVGTGRAKVDRVASNRRYIDAGGKVRYDRMSATRDPNIRAGEEGTIDPYLTTVSLWDGDTPRLALSAYATHPMSYYGKGGVSADFVGQARKRRQADTPDTVQMYVSGCSGNVTAGKYNDGDPANRSVLADRLFRAMTTAWQETKKAPISAVQFRSVPLMLEARSSVGFSEQELNRRLSSDPKPFGRCLAALGLSWKKRVDAGTPIDLPVLDFGRAVLTVLPAEAYVEYQLLAQKQRPEACVLVAGYGECGPGYIPIERAWAENDGNLADWCWVEKGSEKRLATAVEMAMKPK